MRKERALKIEAGKLDRLYDIVSNRPGEDVRELRALSYLAGARQALSWSLSTEICVGRTPVIPSPSCCDKQNGGFRRQYTWRS